MLAKAWCKKMSLLRVSGCGVSTLTRSLRLRVTCDMYHHQSAHLIPPYLLYQHNYALEVDSMYQSVALSCSWVHATYCRHFYNHSVGMKPLITQLRGTRIEPHCVHGRSGRRKQRDLVIHKPINKSSSEGFLLQLVQNGLDPLYGLLSGLPDGLQSLSLHRVQHQQLFGQQFLQTSVILVWLFANKLVNIFLKQQHPGHDLLDPC